MKISIVFVLYVANMSIKSKKTTNAQFKRPIKNVLPINNVLTKIKMLKNNWFIQNHYILSVKVILTIQDIIFVSVVRSTYCQ